MSSASMGRSPTKADRGRAASRSTKSRNGCARIPRRRATSNSSKKKGRMGEGENGRARTIRTRDSLPFSNRDRRRLLFLGHLQEHLLERPVQVGALTQLVERAAADQ